MREIWRWFKLPFAIIFGIGMTIKMKYPLIFYVDKLDDNFAGRANGPFISILKSHREDEGLRNHELVHVKQWFTKGFIVHSLRYQFSRTYRYWSEIEAYKKQMETDNLPNLFAGFIFRLYDLNLKISIDDIIRDLQ